MPKFQVGEVAIAVKLRFEYQHLEGMEVTIVGIRGELYSDMFGFQMYYYIVCDEINEPNLIAVETCLRKKDEPDEEASWESIQELTNWNPTKVKQNG